MNKEKLDTLWEACRDGSISESDRAVFDRYLNENDQAAALWEAESQWLAMMSDVDGAMAQEPAGRDGHAFAISVLDQWQVQQEREALGVVATIGPTLATGFVRRYAGIAAMLALFLGAAIYVGILTANKQPTDGGPVAIVPPKDTQPDGKSPAAATAPDAIGLLMSSAKENYALAAAQPSRLRQGFADTAAMFDVANLASLLDPGLPDPAEFVVPVNGG